VGGSTTLDLVNCVLVQVNKVDAHVNAQQRNRFDDATTVAAKQNNYGGTLDEITTAQCFLDASKSRVHAFRRTATNSLDQFMEDQQADFRRPAQ
jgi:uncharacterized protein YecT (DUF1311 family)